MKRPPLRMLAGAAAIALLLGGATAANAASDNTNPAAGRQSAAGRDGDLARDFDAVDRNTAWTQVDKLKLNFPTYHTEGLAITADHLFLSAVQILEPTQKYPGPVSGYDRTPGKGVGHLFVMDRQGHLQKDIMLGDGDMYHPGGISSDGTNVWVPVAQYRPNSSAIIYRVDATQPRRHRAVPRRGPHRRHRRDQTTGHLVGNTWGSRRFYEWTPTAQADPWDNPSYFIDYQDCQYVPSAKMICGGVTNLPQTPVRRRCRATYELGGVAMIDLQSHAILREVPFQKWSTAGHVMTRNPVKLAAEGNQLTLWGRPTTATRATAPSCSPIRPAFRAEPTGWAVPFPRA